MQTVDDGQTNSMSAPDMSQVLRSFSRGHIPLGMGPDSKLPCTSSTVSGTFCNEAKDGGMVPVRRFCARWISDRAVNKPSTRGRVPVS